MNTVNVILMCKVLLHGQSCCEELPNLEILYIVVK